MYFLGVWALWRLWRLVVVASGVCLGDWSWCMSWWRVACVSRRVPYLCTNYGKRPTRPRDGRRRDASPSSRVESRPEPRTRETCMSVWRERESYTMIHARRHVDVRCRWRRRRGGENVTREK